MAPGSQNKARLPSRQAFGILEIVIAVAIISASLFALVSIFILSRDTIVYSVQKLQASFLAEEGLEVLRFKRDSGWTGSIKTLTAGNNYFLSFSTSTSVWTITSSPEPQINGLFLRSFTIQNISRDSSANIESSYVAADDDPGTKKVSFKVDWTYKNKSQSLKEETYLTDLFSN